MAKQSGRILGATFGDYDNRPLGVPTQVTIDGKPRLVGPFLELRTKRPMGDDTPVERVYLWNLDPKTLLGRLIDDKGGDTERYQLYVDDWLLNAQGGLVARSLYDFRGGVFRIEMKPDGKWKPALSRKIVDKSHTFAPYLVGLGRTDGSIVILDQAKDAGASAGAPVYHYYELSADGGLSPPLEPDDAARDRPILGPDGRLKGFIQDGAGETYVLSDPYLQTLYQKAQDTLPGETVRVVATGADPRKMVVYAGGREDPGAYYLLDFSEGTSAIVGDDYPLVPSAWFAPQSELTYKAADGLEINAILTVPPKPKAQNLPLVVLPHDGLQAHDRLGFDWLAQALASRGYLVLQPQFRGSDGNGQALMEAGYGQLGRKMQTDISDGVRQLVSQGLADPKRVCILGVGWGGYAALIAAETDGATYRCAGSLNGVADLEAMAGVLKHKETLGEQDHITTLVADLKWPRTFDSNPDSPRILAGYVGADTAAVSPVKLADGAAAPILIVSSHDKLVPPQQSREMRDALLTRHKPVEFVEVEKGDHALTTKEARLATLKAVMDFLAKNNPVD